MKTYVVGDIHGQRDQTITLLRGAGLIDTLERWSGGDALLIFIGDFFDRGPDGVGTVDLVMRLEREAPMTGGRVRAIMGNHDMLILSAYYFRHRPAGGPAGNFHDDWLHNGGIAADMQRLTPDHIAWLANLPAMVLEHDQLYMHADAMFYAEYGRSVEEVNTAIHSLMHEPTETAWDRLLDQFSQRFAFTDTGGDQRARSMLRTFGGRQIVHGHTPIWKMIDRAAEDITEAYVYADGLCVDVDGGMVTGGPGFVYEVSPMEA